MLLLAIAIATIDTNSNGWFLQKRFGQYGKPFTIYKLRTMHLKTNKVFSISAFLRRLN
jgi:lipopolysaccharide/colanic/teichoic acid biosynthesis glycosyltransferase